MECAGHTDLPASPGPSDDPARRGSREMRLIGQALGLLVQSMWERMEVSFSRGHKPGTRSRGDFRPGCSSFLAIYGPLEAVLPFVLPNKLAPDFQVSQGLGKHLSRLVPSLCVCLLGSHLGSVHRQASPLRLSGAPSSVGTKVPPAGTPEWESLHPPKVQLPLILPQIPP